MSRKSTATMPPKRDRGVGRLNPLGEKGGGSAKTMSVVRAVYAQPAGYNAWNASMKGRGQPHAHSLVHPDIRLGACQRRLENITAIQHYVASSSPKHGAFTGRSDLVRSPAQHDGPRTETCGARRRLQQLNTNHKDSCGRPFTSPADHPHSATLDALLFLARAQNKRKNYPTSRGCREGYHIRPGRRTLQHRHERCPYPLPSNASRGRHRWKDTRCSARDIRW